MMTDDSKFTTCDGMYLWSWPCDKGQLYKLVLYLVIFKTSKLIYTPALAELYWTQCFSYDDISVHLWVSTQKKGKPCFVLLICCFLRSEWIFISLNNQFPVKDLSDLMMVKLLLCIFNYYLKWQLRLSLSVNQHGAPGMGVIPDWKMIILKETLNLIK